jgi:hypothetical protein
MTTALPDPDTVADDLCVDPEAVARAIGLSYGSLNSDQQETIADSIRDAQADVEAFLGRPIIPIQFTDTDVAPSGDRWELAEQPVQDILTITPILIDNQPTGMYDVTYMAGLDARTDGNLGPIRRYVSAHAAASPMVTRLSSGGRQITSVSVDGQSITYSDSGAAGSGAPGSLPNITSLNRWRVAGRRVFQRRNTTSGVVREPSAWRY